MSPLHITNICSLCIFLLQKFVVSAFSDYKICSVRFFITKVCSVRFFRLKKFVVSLFQTTSMLFSLQRFVVSAFSDYKTL
ncbi:hypothetical protein K443DRAFT_111287 [Laccaria amethystina LaAM-08-1]|uniref:Secreted protein n=1 Tax=Laccaria amethystina LaAM-08-1 TaxID=1095629 RepID=A0A0C9WRC9_9AGAR|nr:hypothetical protein K443DRAFT_111287 [Laccaria amethystina LaAM-08-1]